MIYKRIIGLSLILFAACSFAKDNPDSGAGWIVRPLSFEPVSIFGTHKTLWVCGSNEGIASSVDGVVWTIRHSNGAAASPLLLGIGFTSDSFGYAYGTGGTLLTTADGGATWTESQLGNEAILQGSFVDATHGVFRTRSSLFYIDDGAPKAIPLPKNAPADFKETVDPVALTPMKMSIQLSEGWRSRAGFVFTNDGGKTWDFYEPAHMQPNGQLGLDGSYWIYGTETIGYDAKWEGGLGVPLLMDSTDGRNWTHTASDMHVCHWEGCDLCRTAGCLASSDRLVNAYGDLSVNKTFPVGHLTAEWSAIGDVVCTVDGKIFCAPLRKTVFIDKPDGVGAAPSAQRTPPLGTKAASGMLRCIRCSHDSMFVDQSKSGIFDVKVDLTVGANGIPQSVTVSGAPSDDVQIHLQKQVESWIFEPVLKDGKPVNVKTSMQTKIQVLKSR